MRRDICTVATQAMRMDDIPDSGDLDGLALLVRRAIWAVERMALLDHERQAWIAGIEAAYKTAVKLERFVLELAERGELQDGDLRTSELVGSCNCPS